MANGVFKSYSDIWTQTNHIHIGPRLQSIQRAFSHEELKNFTNSGRFNLEFDGRTKTTMIIADANTLNELESALEFMALQIDMMLEDVQKKIEGESEADAALREAERSANPMLDVDTDEND